MVTRVVGMAAEIKIDQRIKTTAEETTETTTVTVTEETTTEPITETTTETTTVQVTETTTVTTTLNSLAEQGKDYLGRFYVTGYTAEEGFPRGSATASGAGVREGYCALNDSQRKALGIKYGEYIYVEGLGKYQVMDCGCRSGVVDIWVPTNAEAYSITGYYEVYR